MDDRKIIKLYLERNEKAISCTAEKYGAYCFFISDNILKDKADADECVNDTYLKTWNSIPPHKPEKLSAFLGKIVRNLSFNRYKMKRAEKRGGGQIEVVLDELEECIPGKSVEEEIEKKELTAMLNTFVSSLSEKQKRVFVSRYWYACSVSDIARSMGMTETSVSVTLNRLRKKLCSYLAERGIRS
ncbi:MAG: sigma-70 family RNA polymerase sigma factor [Ruminococcus sp.]|nr:sigma-70 family RNA polymerase sigma factor [Ruminococcus sp.]